MFELGTKMFQKCFSILNNWVEYYNDVISPLYYKNESLPFKSQNYAIFWQSGIKSRLDRDFLATCVRNNVWFSVFSFWTAT